MSGAILFGISSIGKTHLINQNKSPYLKDADVLVSDDGPGFPEIDHWWEPGKMSEQDLNDFGESVYQHLALHASESWILTGIGPVPEWVWNLPQDKGIDIKFIVTTKEHLSLNLSRRAESGNTTQPLDIEEIWSAYVKFLNIAASKGIELIRYDQVQSKFNTYLKQRRNGILDVKSAWVDETGGEYVYFTWNGLSVLVDANGMSCEFHVNGPNLWDIVDLDSVKHYIIGKDFDPSLASRALRVFKRVKHRVN